MYLRHTRRQNRDGSTVGCYALAENVWNPNAQRSKAKVVHSFGRADQLDKAALGRLVHSIRRVLVDDGVQEVMAEGKPVKVADIEIERVQELSIIHVAKALWDVCVVDATGSIVREATVAGDPDALIGWFSDMDVALSRIGLEAGPLSQRLYGGLAKISIAVELLETRHVWDAFKAMPIKTVRKDAQGIARLMRLGWFRPVHCKSLPAQEVRAMLAARKLVQAKLHDVEMSLRGILRGFGLKVGRTMPRTFEARLRELVEGHPTLTTIADALLATSG